MHCSVVVLAKASVKVKAAYNASQRHGMVMTSSMGESVGQRGRGTWIPLLLCFSTLACSRVLGPLAEFQGDCKNRGGDSAYIGDPLTVELELSSLLCHLE